MDYHQFSPQQLAQQYSPSSCIDDIEVFLHRYRTLSDQAFAWAQQRDCVAANLAYGDSADECLDLYFPTHASQRKLQVYIHGGYWQQLSKQDSAFAATNFQQLGCHYAVIDYSLAPSASLTDIVQQNQRALVWLYNNAERFGYDSSQIYISGSSAGAHLAMLMAQTDWRLLHLKQAQIIAGICAVSGIYDLSPIAQTYINEPLQLTNEEIQTLSPIRLGKRPKCEVIIAFAENETSEFKRQSKAMAARLAVPWLTIAQRNHFDVILELTDKHSVLCQQVMAQMGLR